MGNKPNSDFEHMLLLRTKHLPSEGLEQWITAICRSCNLHLTLQKPNQGAQIFAICWTFNESLILVNQDVKQDKKLRF